MQETYSLCCSVSLFPGAGRGLLTPGPGGYLAWMGGYLTWPEKVGTLHHMEGSYSPCQLEARYPPPGVDRHRDRRMSKHYLH